MHEGKYQDQGSVQEHEPASGSAKEKPGHQKIFIDNEKQDDQNGRNAPHQDGNAQREKVARRKDNKHRNGENDQYLNEYRVDVP